MKGILEKISKLAIKLDDIDFNKETKTSLWLGFEPAPNDLITKKEQELGLNLPKEYLDFVQTTNGFLAPNDIEPTFIAIQNINYLKNIDPSLIEIWKSHGHNGIASQLEKSILIAGYLDGLMEEQIFLMIPQSNNKWKFWKFAAWIPGEEEFENLNTYFAVVSDFLEDEILTKE